MVSEKDLLFCGYFLFKVFVREGKTLMTVKVGLDVTEDITDLLTTLEDHLGDIDDLRLF